MSQETKNNKEVKACTCCGETFPNTKEYFGIINNGKIGSVCRKCIAIKRKKYNENRKNRFSSNEIEYDGEKICSRCGKSLPNSYRYFPVDKTMSTGLRNVCRECDPKYGHFLIDGKELNQKWTDAENELLKSIYMDYSGKELQEKFFQNHTLNSVRTQIYLLGLSGKSELGIKSGNAYRSKEINQKTGKSYFDEWSEKISVGNKIYYETHDSVWKGVKRPDISLLSSQRRIGKWAGDNNPRHINPLFGSDNGNWNGGTTSLYAELRFELTDWKTSIMNYCGYKCIITGGKFDHIHHITPFKEILDEVFRITNLPVKDHSIDYSYNEYELLSSTLISLHDEIGYGACMNDNVHMLFHKNYGYHKFTKYNFLDFIYRIDCGEFDKWFEENGLQININYDYVEYLEGAFQEMKSA